jgi:hypothetical protein
MLLPPTRGAYDGLGREHGREETSHSSPAI